MTELNEKTAALVRMARANDRRLKSIKDKENSDAKASDKKESRRMAVSDYKKRTKV